MIVKDTSKQFYFILSNPISVDDRYYDLNYNVAIKIEYLSDGNIFSSCEEMQSHGYGKTINETIESF